MPRPRLFVGSSSEGLAIAQAIQSLLDPVSEVALWTQGVFGLTQGTLESLVAASAGFDFAILVLTADDLSMSRGEARAAARDNVLFELGVFIGSLGRDRTFIVYDRTDPPALPSDLAGVTAATFMPHEDGNLEAALGAACTAIQQEIRKLGIRQRAVRDAPAGRFAGLREGCAVGRREIVSGVVTGLPAGTQAWILVRPLLEGVRYWPQDELLPDKAGDFRSAAYFGQSPEKNIGEEFILLLVQAAPAATAQFRAFLKDPRDGITELPQGVQVLDQLTVRRR